MFVLTPSTAPSQLSTWSGTVKVSRNLLQSVVFNKIYILPSDCFKEEDFKEKIFQEQNRLNRNKYAEESFY